MNLHTLALLTLMAATLAAVAYIHEQDYREQSAPECAPTEHQASETRYHPPVAAFLSRNNRRFL